MIEENPEQENPDIGGSRFVVPIRDILTSLIRGRKTLTLAFLAPIAISVVVALALPKSYESEAHLLVLPDPQYSELPPDRANTVLPSADSAQISKIEVEILDSRELKRAVAANLGPHVIDSSLPADVKSGPAYDRLLSIAADRLNDLITVEPQVDSSIIRIRFTDHDVQIARQGLSALLDAYLAYRLQVFERDRLPFLLTKREEAAARLEAARTALTDFRQAHDIVSLPTQILLLLEEQMKLTMAAMQARETAAERSAAVTTLAANVAQLPAKVFLTSDRDRVSETGNSRGILLGLQLRRQELLAKYSDTSHYVTDIDQQIAALKSFENNNGLRPSETVASGLNPVVEQMNGELRTFEQDRAGSEARSQEIERQAETVRQRLVDLIGLRLEFRRLERAVDLADAQYRIFLKHYQDAQVSESVDRQSVPNVRVIERSSPDRSVNGYRRLIVGFGIIIGLAAALFAAFVGSAFRETLVTPSAAARRLRLPVLAKVDLRESGQS